MTCTHQSQPCAVCPVYRGDCPDCGLPLGRVPQQGYVCLQCRSLLRSQLTEIVTLWPMAAAEVALGKGADDAGSAGSLGVRVSALDFAAGNDVLPVLEEWERTWRLLLGHAAFGIATELRWERCATIGEVLADTVGYLLGVFDAICDRDDGGLPEFAQEVREELRTARVAARQVPPNQWRVSCPTDECGRILRIERAQLDESVVCEGCGRNWTVHRLLAVAAADAEAEIWLSSEDVALLAMVPERTLRDWGKKELVQRRGGLYELGSVRRHLLAKVS